MQSAERHKLSRNGCIIINWLSQAVQTIRIVNSWNNSHESNNIKR